MDILVLVLASLLVLPPVHGNSLVLADAPFIAALCFAVCRAWARPKQRTYPTVRAAIVFLALCVIHLAFVAFGQVSILEYIRGLIPFIFVGFGWMTTKLVRAADIPRLMTAMVVIGLVFAGQGLLEFPAWLAGDVWRTSYHNPNHSIPFPLIAFHISAARACLGKRSARARICYLAACGITLLSILCTGTRSLLLGAIVALPGIVVFAQHSYRAAVRLACAVALAATILVAIVPTVNLAHAFRIDANAETARFVSGDSGLASRAEENGVALKYFFASPLIGTGLGFRFDTIGLYYGVERVGYIHNSYLYLLMDFGIFGLLYFSPAAVAIVSLLKRKASLEESTAAGLVTGITSLLIYIVGFSMVRVIQYNVLLFCLIALADVLAHDWAGHRIVRLRKWRTFPQGRPIGRPSPFGGKIPAMPAGR